MGYLAKFTFLISNRFVNQVALGSLIAKYSGFILKLVWYYSLAISWSIFGILSKNVHTKATLKTCFLFDSLVKQTMQLLNNSEH